MSSNQTYLDQATPVGLHPALRFLMLVTVVVLTPALVISAVLTVGRIRLDHHIAAIRASGEPTNVRELAEKFPPIAEERNAAIPLIEASKILREKGTSKELIDRYKENISEQGNRPFKPLTPEYREFVKLLIAQHPKSLALLHDAAQRPECRFPIDKACDLDPVIKLLKRKIELETDDGNADALYQDLMDLIRINTLLSNDPLPQYCDRPLTNHRQASTVISLEFALSRCMLSSEQLRNLAVAVKGLEDPDFLHNGMLGTRYNFLEMYSRARTGRPGTYQDNDGVLSVTDTLDAINGLPVSTFDNPLRIDAQLGLLNDQIAISLQTPDERKRLLGAYEKRLDENSLLRLPCLTYGDYRRWDLVLKSYVALGETAMALYRYHLDKSAWPADLKELVPQYLDAIPLDPYDPSNTAPIHYINGPSGVRVYSVGNDRKDNNGLSAWEKNTETESTNTPSSHTFSNPDPVFILQLPI